MYFLVHVFFLHMWSTSYVCSIQIISIWDSGDCFWDRQLGVSAVIITWVRINYGSFGTLSSCKNMVCNLSFVEYIRHILNGYNH